MKFILLHEAKNDEGIRAFFTDVWELYIKVSLVSRPSGSIVVMSFVLQTMLNPFHTAHTSIRSQVFDTRVRASAKKHL
jgi:trafficking protein particle complex subunit 2